MNVLDLFSGIGGFSLGLERAGMRTVAFCERNPYCRAVLRKHWPDVPVYDDVRELTGNQLRADGISVDVICGGFPCQPFSSAARGRNRSDKNLWPEMRRIISECQPYWIICENVVGFDRMAIRQMVVDLEGLGYEVAPPFEIPACAVGHDHRRSRLWIVAYADNEKQSIRSFDAQMAELSGSRSFTGSGRKEDGIPLELDLIRSRGDRLRALGNAVVPQIPEIIGRAIMRTL